MHFLNQTTVKDIARLINTSCLKADSQTSLETLAEMLCTSDRYKVYRTNQNQQFCGVIQARQIAMEVLKLSKHEKDAEEMLPAIVYVLNFRHATDLAEDAVTVRSCDTLQTVLTLRYHNRVREIAVVDKNRHLFGTLEAKHILSHYLHEKAEMSL